MYLVARDKTTNATKGYSFCCNGCGKQSKLVRLSKGQYPLKDETFGEFFKRIGRKLPDRWVEAMELHYNHQGLHPRHSGFVVNYYCYGCHSDGVTARTVAATTKKFYRTKKKKEQHEASALHAG